MANLILIERYIGCIDEKFAKQPKPDVQSDREANVMAIELIKARPAS